MKRYLFLLVALVLVISSCDLFMDDTSESEGDNNEYREVEKTLGRGYNVFGQYAQISSVKSTVFDFNALVGDDFIEATSLDETNYIVASGASSFAYQHQLGVQADISGSSKFFSASLSSSYSSSEVNNSSREFATIHVNNNRNQYVIKNRTDRATLKDYLDPTFKERLNDASYDPEDLFDIYGTHVLMGLKTGARFDYHFSKETQYISKNSSIESEAKASFHSMFSTVSVGVGINTDSSSEYQSTSELSVTKVVGGNSNIAVATDDGLSEWLIHLDDTNSVFSNFLDEDGLLPIWDFCDNVERQTQLKNAFTAYADAINALDTTTLTLEIKRLRNQSFNSDEDTKNNTEWYWEMVAATDNPENVIPLTRHNTIGLSDGHQFVIGVERKITFYKNQESTMIINGNLVEQDGRTSDDAVSTFYHGPDFKYRYSNGTFKFDSVIDKINWITPYLTTIIENNRVTSFSTPMTVREGEGPVTFYQVYRSNNNEVIWFEFTAELNDDE